MTGMYHRRVVGTYGVLSMGGRWIGDVRSSRYGAEWHTLNGLIFQAWILVPLLVHFEESNSHYNCIYN